MFNGFRKSGIRIGTMDLKTACIAMANKALLLTANRRDFEKVPGLEIRELARIRNPAETSRYGVRRPPSPRWLQRLDAQQKSARVPEIASEFARCLRWA